mmetsp:Transcript_5773/g.21825  ORF Transcript_5773/g.21825 Transcript_5773/m.21825 type:complete len:191 (-) Transcript_5773:6-578(-)
MVGLLEEEKEITPRHLRFQQSYIRHEEILGFWRVGHSAVGRGGKAKGEVHFSQIHCGHEGMHEHCRLAMYLGHEVLEQKYVPQLVVEAWFILLASQHYCVAGQLQPTQEYAHARAGGARLQRAFPITLIRELITLVRFNETPFSKMYSVMTSQSKLLDDWINRSTDFFQFDHPKRPNHESIFSDDTCFVD